MLFLGSRFSWNISNNFLAYVVRTAYVFMLLFAQRLLLQNRSLILRIVLRAIESMQPIDSDVTNSVTTSTSHTMLSSAMIACYSINMFITQIHNPYSY